MALELGKQEIVKFLSAFSFFLILFTLYIVAESPGVQGYEISIYAEYPQYLWHIILISILLCHVILVINIFFEMNSSISWKAAYIGIVLSNSIILLIPLIRRYTIYGSGDPSTHMGYMLDILRKGDIGTNMYPIEHILGVITHQICAFDLNISLLIYPTIFYIFFALITFLLYGVILDDRPSIFIGMMIAPLLLFGPGTYLFNPNGQMNCYFFFLLYLYFSRFLEKNVVPFEILIIITLIFVTFIHPLGCIFAVIIFAITDLSYYLIKSTDSKININFKKSNFLILTSFVIYFMWQSYVIVFAQSVYRINKWLLLEIGQSQFQHHSELISEMQPTTFFLLDAFVHKYGIYFLIFILSVISIIIITKLWKTKKISINIYNLLFSIGFIFSFVFYILSIFIVSESGFGRICFVAFMFSLLLIPTAFGYLQKLPFNLISKATIILFALFLVTLTYLSIYTIHLTPISNSPGLHVTDSQLVGINSFFEKRNEHLKISEGGVSINRIGDALYGTSSHQNNVVYAENSSIPPHFKFEKNQGEPLYIIIGKLLRIIYPEIIPEYPKSWKFNQTDFNLFENNINVSKIYSNSEIDVYLLKTTHEGISI